MKPSDILHENGNFWVARRVYGTGNFRPKTNGFVVYESGLTHSKEVAQIGLQKAIDRKSVV